VLFVLIMIVNATARILIQRGTRGEK
jgi:hypothetical protein